MPTVTETSAASAEGLSKRYGSQRGVQWSLALARARVGDRPPGQDLLE